MKPIPISVFILGLGWAMVSAMLPVGVLLWRWISLWQDSPDWRIIGPVAVTCAGTGAFGFWRKYNAQISLPPSWAQARDLVGALKHETTVETERRLPETATVKQTQNLPASPDPPREPSA